MNKLLAFCGLCLLALPASQLSAAVCDYRPSSIIGSAGTGAAVTAGTAAAAAGTAAKVAGVYTLTHAVTGATMAGLTTAGASAAGTVGIVAGTGGAIGTAVAVITSPITIVVGAVVAVGVGAYEGACYFTDERITDPDEVSGIVENIVAHVGNPDLFAVMEQDDGVRVLRTFTEVDDSGQPTEWANYDMENLYIVNGLLKHDGWLNTTIGSVHLVPTGPAGETD